MKKKNISKTDRYCCPHCGRDVTDETETEFGIFCPNRCGDFWQSETIPATEIHNYVHVCVPHQYNFMIHKSAFEGVKGAENV
jgi:ribosomal protein L37AE/L43A